MLEDGRAYSASGWATDTTLRAISREIGDPALREWLFDQQRDHLGQAMTSVDLREIAPQYRPVMCTAISRAYERVERDGRFEDLTAAVQEWADWLKRFGDLAEMVTRFAAGEPPGKFNPHMRGVLKARKRRVGPGWD